MANRILVVDDEADLEVLMRQKFRKQIKEGVYSFAFARSGVEALERLREDPEIELVLTDINMPEMDGLTLLARLNELELLLRAVVVSAYGDLANIRTAMNRGAFDFLVKPIDFSDLEITIEKTIRHVDVLRKAVHEHTQLAAIQRELDLAREMQQSVLPSTFPAFPDRTDFDIFAEMIPAKNVGGDFYDFFLLDENRLGIAIGDVSGKGIPAALFMMSSRTLLRARAAQIGSPAACLSEVNDMLCKDNPFSMFVTLFYAVLDLNTGKLAYANGGHNPPYHLVSNEAVNQIPLPGDPALGFMEGVDYQEVSLQLKPHDSLLLYTDGVTEAEDPLQAFYTNERLEKHLATVHNATPKEMVRSVVDAVRSFSNGAIQNDDITVLAFDYRKE